MVSDFLKTLELTENAAIQMAKIEFAKAINKHGRKDYKGCLYIPSGDMSDEELFINGDFDPTFNDDIENEINYVEELGSIGFDKDESIYVSTDMGVYSLDELGFSDIMLLAEYISYLEDETKE